MLYRLTSQSYTFYTLKSIAHILKKSYLLTNIRSIYSVCDLVKYKFHGLNICIWKWYLIPVWSVQLINCVSTCFHLQHKFCPTRELNPTFPESIYITFIAAKIMHSLMNAAECWENVIRDNSSHFYQNDWRRQRFSHEETGKSTWVRETNFWIFQIQNSTK